MQRTRREIRLVAAAIAAVMAVIYLGIGLGVLGVGGSNGDGTFRLAFGTVAGSAFLLGAVLLLASDRRWVWVLGVAFQLFVYWAYVDVSKQRTPPFEVWGITLRVIQVPLLAALVYLAARPPSGSRRPARLSGTGAWPIKSAKSRDIPSKLASRAPIGGRHPPNPANVGPTTAASAADRAIWRVGSAGGPITASRE